MVSGWGVPDPGFPRAPWGAEGGGFAVVALVRRVAGGEAMRYASGGKLAGRLSGLLRVAEQLCGPQNAPAGGVLGFQHFASVPVEQR